VQDCSGFVGDFRQNIVIQRVTVVSFGMNDEGSDFRPISFGNYLRQRQIYY